MYGSKRKICKERQATHLHTGVKPLKTFCILILLQLGELFHGFYTQKIEYLDFWKPGEQKNQLILLLGNWKR